MAGWRAQVSQIVRCNGLSTDLGEGGGRKLRKTSIKGESKGLSVMNFA